MWQNRRADKKEILDLGPEHYTQEEYIKCLQLLDRINQFLGGFKASGRTFKKLKDLTSILEVGCGGGTHCSYLHRLFPKAKVLGIDICKEAIEYSQLSLPQAAKERVFFHHQKEKTLDYPDNSFDVVTTMLVCHHMTDDEIVVFLKESYRVCSQAVIINDLHRHFFAYLSFSLLVPFFFPNRLIWHDGRLSVRRAFRKADFEALLKKAGFQKNQTVLRWHWAFRWTLMVKK